MRQTLRIGVIMVALGTPVAGGAFTVSAPIVELNQIMAFKQELLRYAEMVRQTENQIRQIQNQIMQIKHAYTTVEHGVQNLAKLDLNGAEDLLNLHNTLTGKIRQIDSIGYTVDRTRKNAERLYTKGERTYSAVEKKARELEWAAAEREAAHIAIETQAILDSQEQHERQWQDILNAAHAAEGNLQAQQAGVQAQGLLGSQMQEVAQVLATQARQQSMQALKEATRTEMEQAAIQHITGDIDTTYTPQGKRLNMTRTGRE